jgi:hypothetical protein
MPNWVSTTLTVKGSEEEIKRFADGIKDNSILESYIPCPTELRNTVSGFVGEDKQAEHLAQQESNIAKYGHKDWYEWQYAIWGTKWGDSDTDIGNPLGFSDGSWEMLIHYVTAWGPADAGFLKVSAMFPTLFFIFDYDEEAGFFAGTQVMQDGATVFESMYEPCSYKGEVDYDNEESVSQYEAWKEEKTDAIFAEYAEFRKGISV